MSGYRDKNANAKISRFLASVIWKHTRKGTMLYRSLSLMIDLVTMIVII